MYIGKEYNYIFLYLGDMSMTKKLFSLWGVIAGFLNGLLGAGGGMAVVPILQTKTEIKKSHATCVAIIFPMCIVSAVIYLLNGTVTFSDALPFWIWGIIGALIGTVFLSKFRPVWIRKIFAVLMIWAGYRLLTR